jgi:hypothetical protein
LNPCINPPQKNISSINFKLLKNFPASIKIWKEVTIEELKEVVMKMPQDKSPGLDGWPQELFTFFFDIMGQGLLKVVEEARVTGRVDRAINSTFITLIHKESNPSSFLDLRPISLCNFIHKVSSKVIACKLKSKLLECISSKQISFLQDILISDAIGLVQECMHLAKIKKKDGLFLKVDLKKSYDRVSWSFLILVLI